MIGPVLGIDLGNNGAVAVLSERGDLLSVADIPVLNDGPKRRLTVNAVLLADVLAAVPARHAFIEFVGPWPDDSPQCAFAFGRCRGIVEGVLGARKVPVTWLQTMKWRRLVGLPSKASKDEARGEAIRRWPASSALFALVQDHDRAESALVGMAGLIEMRGPG